MDGPNFIFRRMEQHKRETSSKVFRCPFCSQDENGFRIAPKLKEHIKLSHPAEATSLLTDHHWQAVLSKARDLAKHDTSRAAEHEPTRAPALEPRHARGISYGRASAPPRPRSAVDLVSRETRIEDINRLTLNSLKRPGAEVPVHEPPHAQRSSANRTRRWRGNSDAPATAMDDVVFNRNPVVVKHLYDPQRDPKLSSTRSVQLPSPRPVVRNSYDAIKNGPSQPRSTPTHRRAMDAGLSASQQAAHLEKTMSNESDEPIPELLLQPETRPISHEQLVTEVKNIYAGLVMIEAKCIDVDEKQLKAAREKDSKKKPKLTGEQWQALIALHKTLLHEHHDFFLASQHPSASQALSFLAAKYSMAARMWRHGIHSFLEVLRFRLPDSLDHMLAFIYIAYQMMTLLYETVPAFADTWVECLGDLGRYRMAIEDDDHKDREIWSAVACMWYVKASAKTPEVGRLYHHQAILAKAYSVQQFSLYLTALTCQIPFENGRVSIMTVLTPVVEKTDLIKRQSSEFDVMFIKTHALNMLERPKADFDACFEILVTKRSFELYIEQGGEKLNKTGVAIAMCNVAACFAYGAADAEKNSLSPLRLSYRHDLAEARRIAAEVAARTNPIDPAPPTTLPVDTKLSAEAVKSGLTMLRSANKIAFSMLRIVLSMRHNVVLYSFVHVYMAWFLSLNSGSQAMRLVLGQVPRPELAEWLNSLPASTDIKNKARATDFPKPDRGEVGRPFPEDWVLLGQVYTQHYYPADWFSASRLDEEERQLEQASMQLQRVLRLRWIGHQLVQKGLLLQYDETSGMFSALPVTPEEKDNEEDSIMEDAIMVEAEDTEMPPGTSTGWSSSNMDTDVTDTTRGGSVETPNGSTSTEDVREKFAPTSSVRILKRGSALLSPTMDDTEMETHSVSTSIEPKPSPGHETKPTGEVVVADRENTADSDGKMDMSEQASKVTTAQEMDSEPC